MIQNFRKGVLVVISVMMIPGLTQAASDTSKEIHRTVSVQGQGRVTAIPDIANLTVEVRQEGDSLDAISGRVRQAMTHLMDVLKAQGIADKDLQTVAYQVEPRYQHDKQGNARPNGFVVLNRLAVKVRDLKKVGKILSVAVESGATSVTGPDFDFDAPQVLERKALALAVEDARAKAQILAEAAGTRVGPVETISQMGGVVWPMHRAATGMRAMAMAADAVEPVAAGEQAFTSNVQAVFSLQY